MKAREEFKLGIVGLGYVGLPLYIEFSKFFETVGYDISAKRITELCGGFDRTREIDSEDLKTERCQFTSNPAVFSSLDAIIVTVPTPVDEFNVPDLSMIENASRAIGKHMKRGAIIIFESTVYPGVTEEVCKPLLETTSGLTCDEGFSVGYSPERINPGDKVNKLANITKIISASNENALETMQFIYSKVIKVGLHIAPNIRVAEAAKIIENTQRDVNIALINELTQLFSILDIPVKDVLAAASTKWNFLNFQPGLVGGHCIGVDPYYLTHLAHKVGFHPQMISAGRRTNDKMHVFYAKKFIMNLMQAGLRPNAKILVLGLTFKENCPDLRNSRVLNLIEELETYELDVEVYDPIAEVDEINALNLKISKNQELSEYAGVILAVPHTELINFVKQGFKDELLSDTLFYDLKGVLPKSFLCLQN